MCTQETLLVLGHKFRAVGRINQILPWGAYSANGNKTWKVGINHKAGGAKGGGRSWGSMERRKRYIALAGHLVWRFDMLGSFFIFLTMIKSSIPFQRRWSCARYFAMQRWKLKVVPVSDLICMIEIQDKTVGKLLQRTGTIGNELPVKDTF